MFFSMFNAELIATSPSTVIVWGADTVIAEFMVSEPVIRLGLRGSFVVIQVHGSLIVQLPSTGAPPWLQQRPPVT
jgi:hypothetical protein